jgi:hypothetical protein
MGPLSYNHSYVIGEGCTVGVDGDHWYGGFEDSVFEQHVLGFIEESPADAQPIFVFWAPVGWCRFSCSFRKGSREIDMHVAARS